MHMVKVYTVYVYKTYNSIVCTCWCLEVTAGTVHRMKQFHVLFMVHLNAGLIKTFLCT
jgi:hypothetical protein